MDELLVEVAKQVPALVVLMVIVRAFLKTLSDQAAEFRLISEHCHEVQQESTKGLRENTKAIHGLSEAIASLNGAKP